MGARTPEKAMEGVKAVLQAKLAKLTEERNKVIAQIGRVEAAIGILSDARPPAPQFLGEGKEDE